MAKCSRYKFPINTHLVLQHDYDLSRKVELGIINLARCGILSAFHTLTLIWTSLQNFWAKC